MPTLDITNLKTAITSKLSSYDSSESLLDTLLNERVAYQNDIAVSGGFADEASLPVFDSAFEGSIVFLSSSSRLQNNALFSGTSSKGWNKSVSNNAPINGGYFGFNAAYFFRPTPTMGRMPFASEVFAQKGPETSSSLPSAADTAGMSSYTHGYISGGESISFTPRPSAPDLTLVVKFNFADNTPVNPLPGGGNMSIARINHIAWTNREGNVGYVKSSSAGAANPNYSIDEYSYASDTASAASSGVGMSGQTSNSFVSPTSGYSYYNTSSAEAVPLITGGSYPAVSGRGIWTFPFAIYTQRIAVGFDSHIYGTQMAATATDTDAYLRSGTASFSPSLTFTINKYPFSSFVGNLDVSDLSTFTSNNATSYEFTDASIGFDDCSAYASTNGKLYYIGGGSPVPSGLTNQSFSTSSSVFTHLGNNLSLSEKFGCGLTY